MKAANTNENPDIVPTCWNPQGRSLDSSNEMNSSAPYLLTAELKKSDVNEYT